MSAFVLQLVAAMLCSTFYCRLWEFDERWQERREVAFAVFLLAFIALMPLAVALHKFLGRSP
jgi:low affinity Fe/Cu permease